MAQEEVIRLFDSAQIRVVWDSDTEKYYFSVVDVIQVLTDSADYQTARKYWKVLKGRLLQEGNEMVTNCYQLKLAAADGKKRLTDITKCIMGKFVVGRGRNSTETYRNCMRKNQIRTKEELSMN